MQTVFDPPARTLVPISGSSLGFPVRRIYCVGRNYADHAREMGGSGREPPFFFAKPGDAACAAPDGGLLQLAWPGATRDLHHEVELVVAIGRAGSAVSVAQADAMVWGYAVGIDLTRRDLQAVAKEQRRPWEVAKGFDASAPMGLLRQRQAGEGMLAHGAIGLRVNGQPRQHGDLADMIWSVDEIVANLSTYFRLEPGDLIFTGTPAGVAALQPGDEVEASIEGLPGLRLRVGERGDVVAPEQDA